MLRKKIWKQEIKMRSHKNKQIQNVIFKKSKKPKREHTNDHLGCNIQHKSITTIKSQPDDDSI